jgi:hypothetical protein
MKNMEETQDLENTEENCEKIGKIWKKMVKR